MFRLWAILIGYIFGCFQTSFFLGKLYKIDIREHGSGNAGFTNANRVLGKKIGAIVFVADILKSIIAYFLCVSMFKNQLAGIWAGFGVILGHDFPFFLKFRGGKGIAASIGLIMAYNWHLAIIAYILGIAAVVVSHKISVGSLIFISSLPFVFLKSGIEIVFLFVAMAILAFWQHRFNIKRILNHEEPNFY